MDYFFLGDPELVTAFRFAGVDGAAVSGAEEARNWFRRITEAPDKTAEPYRVLILTEEVADFLGNTLTRWRLLDRYPLVVELPGLMGRLPGRKTLVDSIREAIGIRV